MPVQRRLAHTGLFAAIGLAAAGIGVVCYRFPEFTRGMYGMVVDHLHRAGAKVVALDVEFTQPTRPPPYVRRRTPLYDTLARLAVQEDNDLGYAAQRARPVVFADTEPEPGTGRTQVFGGHLALIGGRAGFAGFPLDADGVLRRMAYQTDDLKSFAIVAAEAASGRRIEPSALHGRSAWIDYPGPPGTFRSLSFSRVLRGQFPPSSVRGRIVVVGATDRSVHDVHPTSTSGGDEESGARSRRA